MRLISSKSMSPRRWRRSCGSGGTSAASVWCRFFAHEGDVDIPGARRERAVMPLRRGMRPIAPMLIPTFLDAARAAPPMVRPFCVSPFLLARPPKECGTVGVQGKGPGGRT